MNRKQAERFVWLSNALGKLGMSAVEINILLRAERTLGRWATDECNGDIQRDGDDGEGKPFRVYGRNHEHRYAIADREAGALRRVSEICRRHGVTFYHQGDPRGCALYIIRKGDVPKGCDVGAYYSNGLAVCID